MKRLRRKWERADKKAMKRKVKKKQLRRCDGSGKIITVIKKCKNPWDKDDRNWTDDQYWKVLLSNGTADEWDEEWIRDQTTPV